MNILSVFALDNGILRIESSDGRRGIFDVRPYMESAAFTPLKDPDAFRQIVNGGYYIEWECGADLSADSIEAHWQVERDANLCAVAEPPGSYAVRDSAD